MEEYYFHFRFLHVLGVVLFLGNIVISAMWKLRADRTGNPAVMAYAQRLVVRTDKLFTLPGFLLVLLTGFALVTAAGWGFSGPGIGWLHAGITGFVVSGILWGAVLVPVQKKQLRMAEAFADGGEVPDEYRALTKKWAMFGGIATLLPILVLILMVYKPF